jgi:hypothetical protein
VFFERDHFDISIQVPSLDLLFVIENKVRAAERDQQLPDYRDRVRQRYPHQKFLGLFLTPDGYSGEDPAWSCVSYRAVCDEIRRLIEGGEAVAPAVGMALAHYLDLIGTHVAASQDLIDACRKIYQQHRLAIDLIVEHGQVSMLSEAFGLFCNSTPGIQPAGGGNASRVTFIADRWLEVQGFQIADRRRWGAPCPVQCWFRLAETKLQLRLEVGPVEDGGSFDRTAFIEQLRNELNEKSDRKITSIYTRVRLRSTSVTDDGDVEELAQKMSKLWNDMGATGTVDAVVSAAQHCISVASLPG